jgi:TolA-binding protein
MVKYIIAYVLSCILFCYFAYDYGYNKGEIKVGVIKTKMLEEHNKELKDLNSKLSDYNKEIERLNNEQFKFRKEKEKQIFDLNRKYTAALNSLRNRPERTPDSNTTTKADPIICTGNGSTGQQLFREDAEFLIRQAQLAEVLKQSLIECRKN